MTVTESRLLEHDITTLNNKLITQYAEGPVCYPTMLENFYSFPTVTETNPYGLNKLYIRIFFFFHCLKYVPLPIRVVRVVQYFLALRSRSA